MVEILPKDVPEPIMEVGLFTDTPGPECLEPSSFIVFRSSGHNCGDEVCIEIIHNGGWHARCCGTCRQRITCVGGRCGTNGPILTLFRGMDELEGVVGSVAG